MGFWIALGLFILAFILNRASRQLKRAAEEMEDLINEFEDDDNSLRYEMECQHCGYTVTANKVLRHCPHCGIEFRDIRMAESDN